MAKLNLQRPPYNHTLTRAQNYANWINDYWKCKVAYPNNSGDVSSTLVLGVPQDARDKDYSHPDIVWVKMGPNGKLTITRT